MKGRTKVAVVLSALAVLPVGAVAIPAGASVVGGSECAVERLPLPSGVDEAEVILGDPTGASLVGITPDYEYLLWEDGDVVELPDPSGNMTVHDINDSGVVVGHAWDGEAWSAFRYADGEYTMLPVPDDLESADAWGINKRGDIVGYGYPPVALEKTPLYWPADEPGTVRVLNGPGPEKAEVIAYDISDDGAVIGDWWGNPSGAGSYLWPDVDSDPEPLLGSDGKDHADPRSITGNLAVGSDSIYTDEGPRGAVWNLETGELTTYKKDLAAVNRDGDVSFDDAWPAVVVRSDGGFVKLASLGGDRPSNARVVFDRGSDLVAAGKARDENKSWLPVVWRGC